MEADLPINWDLHDPLLERIKSNEFDGINRHVIFVYQQMGSYLSWVCSVFDQNAATEN